MSKRKKKRGFIKRNLPSIIIVLLIAGGGLFYINEIENKEVIENGIATTSSPYHLLENKDSTIYVGHVLIEQNMSILKLSEEFYKNNLFWPYILEVNPDINNILDLEKGRIIKIPRIPAELLDVSNQERMNTLKHLGDSLLNDISEKRKRELDSSNQFNNW